MSNFVNNKDATDTTTNTTTTTTQTTETPPPYARHCHIVKRIDFDGYGFNLHSEKIKPGQYIGKVDEKSPAELAGLKEGDRIIEVNGVPIGNETHKQVVQRIKAIACEVRLLLIDPKLEKMTLAEMENSTSDAISNNNNNNNKSARSQSPSLVDGAAADGGGGAHDSSSSIRTAPESTTTTTTKSSSSSSFAGTSSNISTISLTSKKRISSTNANNSNGNGNATAAAATDEYVTDNGGQFPNNSINKNGNLPNLMANESINGSGNSSAASTNNNSNNSNNNSSTNSSSKTMMTSGGLNLPLTAAEMRAKLMAKKKFDPKNESLDLKKKFEIIQKL